MSKRYYFISKTFKSFVICTKITSKIMQYVTNLYLRLLLCNKSLKRKIGNPNFHFGRARGGLIFTVLAHSLYLLTQSILKGLDKDTHYMVTSITLLVAQTCMPTSSGWWSHRVCQTVVSQLSYEIVAYRHSHSQLHQDTPRRQTSLLTHYRRLIMYSEVNSFSETLY